MANEFDLDVTFEDAEPDLSGLSEAALLSAVEALPDALRAVAHGLLVERRTMSDVSHPRISCNNCNSVPDRACRPVHV